MLTNQQDEEFYKADEPLDKIVNAFERGEKHVTHAPKLSVDERMRQAALANPGRCITKYWNPNRKQEKWIPINFDPDAWRKLERSAVKRTFKVVKTGFDVKVPADPPSGMKIENLTRPAEWDEYDREPRRRYGYFSSY